MPALTFFATANSDRVDVAAVAALNNLTAMTVLAWGYPTTVANAQAFAGKSGGGAAAGWRFYTAATGPTNLRVRWARNGNANPMDYTSTGGEVAADVWQCFGVTVDQAGGAGNLAHLYRGTLDTPLTEVSGYSKADGSGAWDDDSGSDVDLGNVGSAQNTAFRGDLALVAIFNRVLTLGEMLAWQFAPGRPLPGCVGLWLVGDNGVTSVVDLSGHGGTGTVTGAAVATRGVPVLPNLGGLNAAIRATVSLGMALTAIQDEDIEIDEADVTARGIARLITEAVQVTESFIRVRGLARTVSEVQQIGESLLSRIGLTRARTDSVEVYDGGGSLVLSQLAIRTETVQVAEAKSRLMGIGRTRTDTEQITENTGTQRGLARLFSEAVQVAETVSATRGIKAVRTEVLQVAESFLRFLGLRRVRTESVQAGESKDTRIGRVREHVDGMNILESENTRLGILRGQDDDAEISEATGNRLGFIRDETDVVEVGEGFLTYRGIVRLQTEVIQVAETVLNRLGGILGRLVFTVFLKPALRFQAWLNEEENP